VLIDVCKALVSLAASVEASRVLSVPDKRASCAAELFYFPAAGVFEFQPLRRFFRISGLAHFLNSNPKKSPEPSISQPGDFYGSAQIHAGTRTASRKTALGVAARLHSFRTEKSSSRCIVGGGVTKTEKLTLTDNGKGSTFGSIDGTMACDRKDYGINENIPFMKIANRVEVNVSLKWKRVSGPSSFPSSCRDSNEALVFENHRVPSATKNEQSG